MVESDVILYERDQNIYLMVLVEVVDMEEMEDLTVVEVVDMGKTHLVDLILEVEEDILVEAEIIVEVADHMGMVEMVSMMVY